MNNKILNLLTLILMMFTSFLVIMTGNRQYQTEKVVSQFNLSSEFHPFSLPDQENVSQSRCRKRLEVLNQISDQTGINYLNRRLFSASPMTGHRLNYSRSIDRVTFAVHTVRRTRLMENFEMKPSLIEHGRTFKIPSLHGYSSNVMPVEDIMNGSNCREGTFFIEASDEKQVDEFISLLKDRLNESEHQSFRNSDFKVNPEFISELSPDDGDNPGQIMVTSLLFMIIFLITLILSSSRELAVHRMNGLSIRSSFLVLLGKGWLVSCITTLAVDFVCRAAFNWNWSVSASMCQIAVMISMPAVFMTVAGLLQSPHLAGQVNGRSHGRMMFTAMYAAKGIALAACFFSMIPLAQLVETSCRPTSASGQHDSHAVFYPVQDGNNTIQQLMRDAGNREIIYRKLNSMGALLIDDNALHQPEDVPQEIRFVSVNPNYLKQFPLYDSKGRRIRVSDNDDRIILCIPENRQGFTRGLLRYVRRNARKELGHVPKIKIYHTVPSGNRNFRNFNDGKLMNRDTVFVMTYENSTPISRNIMNGEGENDCLKIPVGKSVSKTYSSIEPLLRRHDMDDNYRQLVRISDLKEEDMRMELGDLREDLLLFLAGTLLTLSMSGYTALLFFKAFKREIILKRALGFTSVRACRGLTALLALQYAVMIAFLFRQDMFNSLNIILLIGTAVTELVINMMTIRHLEKKEMGGVLNGE